MAASNKNKHLTYEERVIILTGIQNNSTKSAIAKNLGKEKSTIGKEIKLHRVLRSKTSYPIDCQYFKTCKDRKIKCDSCQTYIPFKCYRRDRSPGACNGCSNIKSCHYDQYYYSPKTAHAEYRETLVTSRDGVDMTTSEALELGSIIKPLLEQGLSPYQILKIHPELNYSEKTLYNYIENDVFRIVGITNLDLRIKVKRKISKKKSTQYKKRHDKKYLKGRTYNDYKAYTETCPDLPVVEMDTVYNDGSNGPFMQTFKFIKYGFMMIIYHNSNSSDEMVSGIDLLENILGKELFKKEVAIILTDRGSEFMNADAIEKLKNGSRRTRLFYCDPMQSGQKGSLENNHKEIRYICPKKADLKEIGLTDQTKANLMTSHINSAPKEFLNGRSPLEMMEFLSPELYKRFKMYGIMNIKKDKVVLKPYLLKE